MGQKYPNNIMGNKKKYIAYNNISKQYILRLEEKIIFQAYTIFWIKKQSLCQNAGMKINGYYTINIFIPTQIIWNNLATIC